jgi:CRISPR locus-related DNA-binding protein
MTKRFHIATLGIHANEKIDYVITKKGADKIGIIYDEINEEEMYKFRNHYLELGVPIVAKKVEPWNYRNILAGILEIATENADYEIEYNVSCGTRVMTAAAHRAAILTDSKIYFVMGDYGDPLEEIVEVQPISVTTLTEPKKNILSKIDELGIIDSQKQLGSKTELKVASISKHLTELDESGYISRERKGRKNMISLTDLGRAILKIKQYRKGKICDGDDYDINKS